MIRVEHLSVRAGPFALRDVSFEVRTGEHAFLMGKTGSGKTTLLEAICGLRPVTAGAIRLMEKDVTGWPPAQRGIGFVPQDAALFHHLTIREHLSFALTIRRWPRNQVEARVAELADWLGLGDLLDRKPPGLSGGEAQRVALGRALSFRPDILCLDEPLSALDDETRSEMGELLRSVRAQTGVTLLHITHNLSEAGRLADRILLLKDGAVEPK
jgi:molybdate/tungstate transport system ATP-binding protein